MNETINYRIEKLDKILAEETKSGQGINRVLFWAYEMSVENNNNYLNFADTIWPDDIAPIVETCRKYGIKEFSISSTCSGLTTTLADFEEHGCKVCGLTKANTRYKGETVPAIKLQVL
ncbi:MAG: hypothetical protein K5780_04115 [Alphaproteobacteria bacterium]|nr:hypothetical protein [Alphaproteobacteria bacterium]